MPDELYRATHSAIDAMSLCQAVKVLSYASPQYPDTQSLFLPNWRH